MMRTEFHTTHEWDSPWRVLWIAIVTAAVVLALTLLVSGAVGSEQEHLVGAWSRAVSEFRDGDFPAAADSLQRAAGAGGQYQHEPAVVDAGLLVWQALAAQVGRDLDLAEQLWLRAELPSDRAHWRHIALASIYLEQGLADEAAEDLARAAGIEPDNPVLHYFTGLLHLERAALARDWYDAIGPVRFVGHAPVKIVPNSRSMYLLAACQELHAAVERPPVDREIPLVDSGMTIVPALRPTVGDLLVALGADAYPGQAHNMLGSLYLQRGLLEQAETHLDEAVAAEQRVLRGYSELAEAFDSERNFTAAGRNYAKAAQTGDAPIRNLRNAWHSFRKAWTE